MRAGLGVDVLLLRPGCLHLVQRLGAAQVDEVDRRASDLGHADCPVGGFGLGNRGPSAGVKLGRGVALRQRSLHQYVDHVPVLSMQADHRPRCPPPGPWL